jgi:hypothetical protein
MSNQLDGRRNQASLIGIKEENNQRKANAENFLSNSSIAKSDFSIIFKNDVFQSKVNAYQDRDDVGDDERRCNFLRRNVGLQELVKGL